MSRLDHDIERGLQQIADRATPSPDAWDSILTRIADQDPTQETEIIMLMESTTKPRRWPLVAAAAAVAALVVGGIALINRGDNAQSPADEVPVPTVAPQPETGTDENQDASQPGASALPAVGATLEPGRYAVDTFGVSLSFEVPASTTSPWTVQVSDDIAVTIGDDDGFVNMSRIGSLYDAEQSEDPDFSGLGSIPPNDIDGWIAANDIIVDDSREVTVGDRSAKLRQVRAPDGAGEESCPPEIQPCVPLSSASADLQGTYDRVSSAVYGQYPHTFWIVELDDFEPLGIWAHTETPDTQAWLDEIAPLIDSIKLGEPAPAVEGGTARLSTFEAAAGPSGTVATSSFTGVRTSGETLEDETIPITGSWTLEGDMTGDVTLSGSNFSVPPNGDLGGTTDYEFTGTIDGLGTGTLTFSDGWVTDLRSGGVATTIWVTGATADFTGLVGTAEVLDRQVTYDGADELISGTITFTLVEPVTVAGNMTVTQTGEPNLDEPWPIERTGPIVGDINGTFTGTGMSSPNGAEVTLDWVMDVTIDGLGSGTLTLRSDEVWTGDGATTATDRVVAGTGDFEGVIGYGTTTHTDDGAVFTAIIELMLAQPAS